jgi:hypothetical protein
VVNWWELFGELLKQPRFADAGRADDHEVLGLSACCMVLQKRLHAIQQVCNRLVLHKAIFDLLDDFRSIHDRLTQPGQQQS